MTKEIILSGIQPSGKIHIGNYLGALKNFVELQNKYESYFFIADYHSITENYDPKIKQQQVFELAKDFLAAGLDPKICTIFVQSHVPEHLELAWIFNCITPIAYLERMTQYKDKALRQKENINMGLFDYPVLQAADILIYKANAVPVGQDQDQHVELTRQIAKFFNNRFGQTFFEPKSVHTQTPKVMSLLAPDKKMSKSLGDGHCINIDDSPEIIRQKISKAVTDTGTGKSLGAKNLLELTKIFSAEKTYSKFSAESKSGNLKYSEIKQKLAEDISNYFSEFRREKEKISDKKIQKILANGAKKAQKVAKKTLAEVRAKIGIR
jgi:tryptophanyl-tRNA synthetase